MRKIRLELDTLSVESFIPSNESPDTRGTVNAHGPTNNRTCPATGMTFCETNCECTFSCPTGCTCTQ
ncbi:MAG TPA: hypothetical protein VFS20_21550 [Longimicrobium sp.]|nr:hypothetical protein [Longimicrobium sp.]